MFEFKDVKFKDILDIPALSIQKEQVTTLVGPSGSGKTTVLRMLNKMLSPTEGRILFQNTDLIQLNSVAHRRKVTMLSQNPAVFEGTVKDNLNVGLIFQKRDLPQDNVLRDILEKVKLQKSLDSPVQSFSGGEKQRLALGRVMLLKPDVYLLDEPSSALDEDTAQLIISMLVDYVRQEQKTLVMVTHAKTIAERYSDAVIEVTRGKCLKRGEPV